MDLRARSTPNPSARSPLAPRPPRAAGPPCVAPGSREEPQPQSLPPRVAGTAALTPPGGRLFSPAPRAVAPPEAGKRGRRAAPPTARPRAAGRPASPPLPPRPRPPSKWPRRCGRGPARPLGLPSADSALTVGPGGHGPGARGHEEAPGGGDGRRGGRARAARWRDARAALSAAQNQQDFQNGG